MNPWDHCVVGSATHHHGEAELRYPDWFLRSWRIEQSASASPHTAKAYRQDFEAIATLLAGDSTRVVDLTPRDITRSRISRLTPVLPGLVFDARVYYCSRRDRTMPTHLAARADTGLHSSQCHNYGGFRLKAPHVYHIVQQPNPHQSITTTPTPTGGDDRLATTVAD